MSTPKTEVKVFTQDKHFQLALRNPTFKRVYDLEIEPTDAVAFGISALMIAGLEKEKLKAWLVGLVDNYPVVNAEVVN